MNRFRTLVLCAAGLAWLQACGPSPQPDVMDVPRTDASDVPRTDATDVPSPEDATDVPSPDDAMDVPSPDDATDVPSPDDATDVPTPDDASDTGPGDAADAGTETMFVAALTGAEENPPVATSATGMAMISLNAARTQIRYTVTHNVMGGTAAHIHTGAGGVNGPVAVTLAPFGTTISGTADVTPAQVADLEAGRLYVNVHSMAHAGGEIRGQILRPGERLFVAQLEGAQEVPPVNTTATGSAAVILNAAGTAVRYHVRSSVMPTNAHVHRAAAGVNGMVVFGLMPLGMTIDGEQAVTAAHVTDLENGMLYVNVHTAAHPGGEIRGQLLPPGSRLFVARLTGSQEVPAVTTMASGNAMVVVNYAADRIRYHVETQMVTPTSAHIHRAPAGVSGPVAVPLAPVGPTIDGTAMITAEDVGRLQRARLYVNVHSAAHPGGEIRGQLLRPGETLFSAVMSGAEENPPVTTTATGGIGVILSPDRTSVRYEGSFTGVMATNAHVHQGPRNANGPVVFPLTISGTDLSGTQMVTAANVAALEAGLLYANVHSMAHPGGEIRGQLAAH